MEDDEINVVATPNGTVERVSCPACGAPRGVGCYTPVNGHDTGWTHDARVYRDMGVRVAPR